MKLIGRESKMITIAVCGPASSGKTTLVNQLAGLTPNIDEPPTMGANVVEFKYGKNQIRLLDLSGSMPQMWTHHYGAAHGAMYVVDAAGASSPENKALFKNLQTNSDLDGKPKLLIPIEKSIYSQACLDGTMIPKTEYIKQQRRDYEVMKNFKTLVCAIVQQFKAIDKKVQHNHDEWTKEKLRKAEIRKAERLRKQKEQEEADEKEKREREEREQRNYQYRMSLLAKRKKEREEAERLEELERMKQELEQIEKETERLEELQKLAEAELENEEKNKVENKEENMEEKEEEFCHPHVILSPGKDSTVKNDEKSEHPETNMACGVVQTPNTLPPINNNNL